MLNKYNVILIFLLQVYQIIPVRLIHPQVKNQNLIYQGLDSHWTDSSSAHMI